MSKFRLDGGYVPNMYSQCIFCKHVHKKMAGDQIQTCDAFPEGIPLHVWNSEDNHSLNIEGDNGIKYEDRMSNGVK